MRLRVTLALLGIILLSWGLTSAAFLHLAWGQWKSVERELREHPGADLHRLLRAYPLVTRLFTVVDAAGRATVLVFPLPVGGGMGVARVLTALGLSFLAGAWLSRTLTRPLEKLEAGARALGAGDFSHRVEVTGSDELARLAVTMNDLAARIAAQIGELEADAARRRQLLADLAHELRTPVATLRAMAEALRDGVAETPERRAQALGALLESSGRLERLVADLLDLARLDLHELPLQRERVDLRALAEAALARHGAAAEKAGVRLLPVRGEAAVVEADPARLAQVLDNLLDNAVSYAGEGAEVWVEVQAGDPARLVLADTGRGVAPEALPLLFDAFYRADAARTPGERHSGLGLRIARGLVEAHGGTLTLTSAPGQGTRVEMALSPAAEQ